METDGDRPVKFETVAVNNFYSFFKTINMGTITKGILGGFSGAVGPVVGASWKGLDVMRSRSRKRSSDSSAAQLEQQLKFSIIMNFLQTFTDVIDITYKQYAVKMTAFNAAFSYHLKNAVAGVSPDFTVDYKEVLVSRGELPNGNAVTASLAGNIIKYNWGDNSGLGRALATDKSVLVIYCKDLDVSLYSYEGPERSVGEALLDVSNFAGHTVETWIGFVSEDGQEVANSIYTGSLQVR